MKKFSIFLIFALFACIGNAATFSYTSKTGDLIGKVQSVNVVVPPHSDLNLDTFAKQYDLSYHELIEANPSLYEASENKTDLSKTLHIILPTLFLLPPKQYRQGIVINLPELRLFYFPKNKNEVITFPVGLGRVGWGTPLMQSSVIYRKHKPTWYAPESIRKEYKKLTGKTLPRVIKPGPDNPLGEFALYLGKRGYLIHGNSDENSVGKFISSGCIRLYNDDIKTLFSIVPDGTPVTVLNHSIKAGMRDGKLYLEAQKPVHLLTGKAQQKQSDLRVNSVRKALQPYLKDNIEINYQALREVLKQRRGIPTAIGIIEHD